jgi:hypothetical protein
MNCYECAIGGEGVVAVAVCKRCGVGMCLEHLALAQDFSVGGIPHACRHPLATKPRGGTRKRSPAERLEGANADRPRQLRAAAAGASWASA